VNLYSLLVFNSTIKSVSANSSSVRSGQKTIHYSVTTQQHTRCKFQSAGHVHMRESMSKDCQFGHTMTSECCQVTMGGRIPCPLVISCCQNTNVSLVLHVATPAAKYNCSAFPLQKPRYSIQQSCMSYEFK